MTDPRLSIHCKGRKEGRKKKEGRTKREREKERKEKERKREREKEERKKERKREREKEERKKERKKGDGAPPCPLFPSLPLSPTFPGGSDFLRPLPAALCPCRTTSKRPYCPSSTMLLVSSQKAIVRSERKAMECQAGKSSRGRAVPLPPAAKRRPTTRLTHPRAG